MSATSRSQILCAFALAACLSACRSDNPPRSSLFPIGNLRGVMFTAPQVLADAKRTDLGGAPNAVVLAVDENSSYRAVANAVARLRDQVVAVGYWIDCGGSTDREPAAADFEARVARVRELLSKHVRVDAVFLAGLEGPPAPCGCGSLECCRPQAGDSAQDAHTAARIVAAVRTFSQGALVVPVWLDGCAPLAHECAARGCADRDCDENATRAWKALRPDSARVALRLRAPAHDSNEGGTIAAAIAARLRLWASPADGPTIAVLCAAEYSPSDFAQALVGARPGSGTGLLLDYANAPVNSGTADPAR